MRRKPANKLARRAKKSHPRQHLRRSRLVHRVQPLYNVVQPPQVYHVRLKDVRPAQLLLRQPPFQHVNPHTPPHKRP